MRWAAPWCRAHYAGLLRDAAGYRKGDANNVNRLLLEQMRGVTRPPRRFVSTLVALRHRRRPRAADRRRPRASARSLAAPRGAGFGYDPLMFIPAFGKTFAELPPDVKNANSHRGQAAQADGRSSIRERWL